MKKRVISFIFSFIVCLFVFGKVPVYAATVEDIALTEGETYSITIPKKQKYYTSSESNGCVSSSAKYKSRKVKITALKPGTATISVVSTKNKTYKYSVTVYQKPVTSPEVKPQDVAGTCPHCKRSGRLQTRPLVYTRNAIKTGYLREPIISAMEVERLYFNSKLTETEIENIIKSWNGVILSKFRNTYSSKLFRYGYSVLLPYEYSNGNNISAYESKVLKEKGIMLQELVRVYDSEKNNNFYLSEWFLTEVEAEPATRKTMDTGIIECTYCGYKYMK